jgi:hypothetical protein
MKKRLTPLVAIVLIIGSGVMIARYFTKTNTPQPIEGVEEELAGFSEVLAQQTARLLGNRGDIVLLTWGPPSDTAPSVRAFCQALQRTGLRLGAKEVVPGVRVNEHLVWPAQSYRELLERYADVGAFVSFIGVPQLSAGDVRALPTRRPKLIVANPCDSAMITRALFQQGLVDGVILPRFSPPASSAPPKTPQQWFDASYQFVTAETAASLPE